MSIDVENSSNNYNLEIATQAVESLVHILSAASVVDKLEGLTRNERDVIAKYIGEWIYALPRIEYVEGMIEIIGENVKNRITSVIFNFSDRWLEELMIDVTRFLAGESSYLLGQDVDQLSENIIEFLHAFGIEKNIIEQFLVEEPIRKTRILCSILAVTLIISTVSEKLWSMRFQ
ncbi:hypothetical protein HS7_16710 [Sulfolobales archaeon HS-7]|nr:hypothetical protein HS7_16710 [Sulfolobales archaeon HS-7]